jgi:N utilization substance protein A
MFVEALDVDEVIAHLLVTEGFSSIEQVAFVPVDDLVEIEGFDEDVAEELRERARGFLEARDQELAKRRSELGVSDDIAAIAGITPVIMVALGEGEIKTLDDLADLAGDELLELLPADVSMSQNQANEIIMAARAHWFPGEDLGASETAESEEAVADEAAIEDVKDE